MTGCRRDWILRAICGGLGLRRRHQGGWKLFWHHQHPHESFIRCASSSLPNHTTLPLTQCIFSRFYSAQRNSDVNSCLKFQQQHQYNPGQLMQCKDLTQQTDKKSFDKKVLKTQFKKESFQKKIVCVFLAKKDGPMTSCNGPQAKTTQCNNCHMTQRPQHTQSPQRPKRVSSVPSIPIVPKRPCSCCIAHRLQCVTSFIITTAIHYCAMWATLHSTAVLCIVLHIW